jgi:hypothetical protein
MLAKKSTMRFIKLIIETDHNFTSIINALGTGVANLRFYGSTMADRRCKCAILRHDRFEHTIHYTSAT